MDNKSKDINNQNLQTTSQTNFISHKQTLRVIPLGGLGEVGKNMMALEYGNDIIVIDMGFAFPDETQPGVDYIIPDISYLKKNRHKIRGHIITHGHMDHIGAAGYILPNIPAPIYGTRLTLEMVKKQIEEFQIGPQQYRVLNPDSHEKIRLGIFEIELIRVAHSIMDSVAVAINTPVGLVIHTGDWRLDPKPVDGKLLDVNRFAALGQQGTLLLMSDSTNCEYPGRGGTEQVVGPTLINLFSRARGRVIVSTFASSITRVQQIVDAAKRTNRKLSFNGRSMLANVELAVKLGYLKVPAGIIIRMQDVPKTPNRNVVILCTGSQGEQNSALSRMATGDHPQIKMRTGDTVIMSSRPIPGNERAIVATVDLLMREGVKVYSDRTKNIDKIGPLHVSGHAYRDDLADMIRLVKPKYFMPIHGEYHMQVYHAQLAIDTGIIKENTFLLNNGDILEIDQNNAKKQDSVSHGNILIDGSGIGDVEGVVLRDRTTMASEGIFVIVTMIDKKTGQLIGSPDIISRGFIYMKENEKFIADVRHEIKKIFAHRNLNEPNDWERFKLKIRDRINDYLYEHTKRNPMVITVINEI